jgi:hypothetical protein
VVRNTGRDMVRLAGDLCVAPTEGDCELSTMVPDVPVLPGLTRRVDLEVPSEAAGDVLIATLSLDLEDFGIVVGECALHPGEVAGDSAEK